MPMKILFITGSARKNSITAELCGIAASAIPDADVTYIRPDGMRIEHCTGCGICSSAERCVVSDDMHIIYDAVEKNEVIVLATPVYFSGPSSIMKQVIDRFQCLWVRRRTKNRFAALIAAGGHERPVFSNTVSIAKAFAASIGAEWLGELTVSGTDNIRDIPESLFREAYSFGSAIAAKYAELTSNRRP